MDTNEALARAWLRANGSGISDSDALAPYHAAQGEKLASVLPRTSDGDAIDYDLAERACRILELSIPSGEVAAVDLSRDYRALVACCK